MRALWYSHGVATRRGPGWRAAMAVESVLGTRVALARGQEESEAISRRSRPADVMAVLPCLYEESDSVIVWAMRSFRGSSVANLEPRHRQRNRHGP